MLLKNQCSHWSDPGNYYISPDMRQIYINIPKNASTWTTALVKSLGWKNDVDGQLTDVGTILLAVRDPVERWTCGIAEYLYRYHPTLTVDSITQHMIDLIFDQVRFDQHTQKQIEFVDGVDTDHAVFFKVDSEYSNNIIDYLNINVGNYFIGPSNATSDNPRKQQIKQFFNDLLDQPKYLSAVKRYYQADYQMIYHAHFYEPK
jgi:hypothetical protein